MTPDEIKYLWTAVIEQALTDAVWHPPRDSVQLQKSTRFFKRERENRAEARDWFEAGGPDFVRACNCAGIAPEYTRRHALEFIKEHDEMAARGERRKRPKKYVVGRKRP